MAEDKLNILISIARQLQHCNSSQIAASVTQIIEILKENKEIQALQSILLSGICKHYSNLKTDTLQQINSILPNDKKLKINDSITKSELIPHIAKINENINENKIANNDNKPEPLTFLKIPSDLKYYLFQYLYENDLYSLEKTCRSVCIDARNQNSLYYIYIKKILNINNYTQNKRYNKIKHLNLCLNDTYCSKYSKYYSDVQTYKILPSVNPFPEIHTIKSSLSTFLYGKHQFDDLLNVFYNVIINGNADKTLIFEASAWAISCPNQFSWIFNTNYNYLAKQILFNVKNLFLNSNYYKYAISIVSNLFSGLTNTNYQLDLFEFNIKYITKEEIDEYWDSDLILNIRKYCKTFNMAYEIKFYEQYEYDSVFWDNFVIQLTDSNCKQLPDTISLRFLFYDEEMDIIINFEQHLNRWLQFDINILKKIGIQNIYIECEYLMIQDDSVIVEHYDENKDEILNHVEKWNKTYKSLKCLLRKCCEKNPLIKHWFGEEDTDIQFEQQLVRSYHISYQLHQH